MEVNNLSSKRGSALLSALFIMTLVAIAATAMSTRLQLDIYRLRLSLTADKLYLASQGITFWALDLMIDPNKKFTESGPEGKLLSYPEKLQHSYPDVLTTGELYDLQARFNLNNLQDKKYHPVFLRLLENAANKNTSTPYKTLIKAILHWIKPYQPGRGQDEFLDYYLKQKPIYLPSFQPLQSVSELRLIKGVSAKLYQTLLPSITVLPETTPININTAPKKLLMALGNGLTESQANELIEARGKKGLLDLHKITLLLQKLDLPAEQITIGSQYFLSVAKASTQDLTLSVYTIIKRSEDKNGQLSSSIVHQSLNTL